MKNKIIYAALAAALFIFGTPLAAQEDAVAESSAALPFTAIQRDPVSAAMGGTLLGSAASGAASAWYSFSNPAALPYSQERFSVGLAYQLWQPSSSNNLCLGAGVNIKDKFGVSAGLALGLNPGIASVDDSGNVGKTFKPTDLQANIGFSYRFVSFLSLGVNARYAMSELSSEYRLSALLFDASLMASLGDFQLTAGVSNLGTRASYGKSSGLSVSYPVPSSLDLALSWSRVFGEDHKLALAADGRWYFSGFGIAASAGASYCWKDMLSFRAGYHYGARMDADYASLGAGVKFYGVALDFTILLAGSSNPVANTIAVGASYSF